MAFWLMKSEPDEFSIDDLAAAPKKTTAWFGVRNYQARNYMRDHMKVGDGVLFYHSSCPEPGIAGIAEVSSAPYPDASQFDAKSPYFDPASKRDEPRWMNVDVKFVKKTRLLGLIHVAAPASRRSALGHCEGPGTRNRRRGARRGRHRASAPGAVPQGVLPLLHGVRGLPDPLWIETEAGSCNARDRGTLCRGRGDRGALEPRGRRRRDALRALHDVLQRELPSRDRDLGGGEPRRGDRRRPGLHRGRME